MALFCPNVNSYRRLTRHQTAPINTHWGYDNRTAGLRCPMPSLTIGALKTAAGAPMQSVHRPGRITGLRFGMIEGLQPTEPIEGSAHDLPFGLPRTLDEALRTFRACEPLVELLGPTFVEAFALVKEAEYEVFLQVISSWEREHLLLNV